MLAEVYVASALGAKPKPKAVARGKPNATDKKVTKHYEMDRPCRHALDDHDDDLFTGANGSHRYITCHACHQHVVLAKRSEPINLWKFLMGIYLFTIRGPRLRDGISSDKKAPRTSKIPAASSTPVQRPAP